MKRKAILRCITRTMMSAALCILLLLTIVPTVQAVGVPQEVLDAAESVVFITAALETKYVRDNDLAEIRKTSPDSIFKSDGKEYIIYNSGSGFVIKNKGGEVLIVTNNHVLEDVSGNIDYDNIFVYLTRERVAHAEIVFAEPEKDLSVIRIRESTNKRTARLATKDAQRGDEAYAVGFPGVADVLSGGIALTSEEATISDGIISAIRSKTDMINAGSVKMLQMNVAINHGNSGGPLFDSKGNVIGINTWGIAEQNMYGAVAVGELWSLLKEYGIDIPTAPADPQEKNIINIIPFVGAGIVTLCAAALIGILLLVKRKQKECAYLEEPEWENSISPYLKKAELQTDVDVLITIGGKGKKDPEDNQSMDDYFKKIEL